MAREKSDNWLSLLCRKKTDQQTRARACGVTAESA
jgi:hypothetical protein